jgi:hypothetical protein
VCTYSRVLSFFRHLTGRKRQAFEISLTKKRILYMFMFSNTCFFCLFLSFLFICMFIYTFGHVESLPLETGECEHDEQKTTADGTVFQVLLLTSCVAKLSS